jgi:DNA-binding NtrC family response regulator
MKHILVADEPVASSGLRKLLELDGYAVTVACSTERALSALEKESFDAVVTALEAPRVRGVEIVRAACASHPRMLVFLVTGYGSSRTCADALECGARKAFDKPLRYEALAQELSDGLATMSA